MADIEVRSVYERDLDLLLLQELHASKQFLAWFLRAVNQPEGLAMRGIARSVTDGIGESDLEVILGDPECETRILVENKINAPPQPDQARGYRTRANQYLSRGCNTVVTVIIAPAQYLRDGVKAMGYDHQV